MTGPERQRLAMVLGLLGSEHEGEVLAAARQAEKMRRQAGLSWHQLLAETAAPEPSWREYTYTKWTPPQPAYYYDPDLDKWRDLLSLAMMRIGFLNDWEQKFVHSLRARSPHLWSDKQKDVLTRIVEKLRQAHGAREAKG